VVGLQHGQALLDVADRRVRLRTVEDARLDAGLVQQADDVVDHAEAVERFVGDDQRATESLAAHDIHRVGEATGADHVFARDEEGIGAHRSSPDCVWMAAVRAAARFLSDCEPGRQKKPRAWGL